MKKSTAKSVAAIRSAGFSHIKFELEAHMHRFNRARLCSDCTGGQMQCSDCTGLGVVLQQPSQAFPVPTYTECKRCQGEGSSTCSTCRGDPNVGHWEDSYCQEFTQDYVLRKLHDTTYRKLRETVPAGSGRGGLSRGVPGLTFGMFYNDGSVDSEFTFTVPIEELWQVPTYLEAFKALGTKMGSSLNTSAAGMHISVLPTENNGNYPGSYRMPAANVNNFVQEVSKLLPALFFVATAGHRTRPMSYRYPRISTGEKYSAIYTHENRCFEYRLFETCYDKPEVIFDFVAVIANTLRFYANPSLKIKELAKKFQFSESSSVAEYYNTPEQLRILNATIKYVKPEDKTFKQLKLERQVKHTVKSLVKTQKIRLAQLHREYAEHKARWEYNLNKPISQAEQRDIDMMMMDEGLTYRQAVEYIKSARVHGRLDVFAEFVRKNNNRRYNRSLEVAV